MFEKPPTIEIKTEAEIFAEKMEEVGRRVDALGEGMDPHIIETVAVLNTLGISTIMSCEGHLDHGLLNPWVAIQAEREPKERFIGERSIKKSIAEKFGISIEDVRKNEDANEEFLNIVMAQKIKETPEHKAWQERNRIMAEKIKSWLEEFYKQRDVDEETKIRLKANGLYGRIYAGNEESTKTARETETEENITKRLSKRQQEMEAFTEFLKSKLQQKTPQ
ncbi:MAG: hypothetical protein HZA36_01485 [Parcubacteria group bacterium]|nr:hypothetical protein [Parcubacteria group bacterium]